MEYVFAALAIAAGIALGRAIDRAILGRFYVMQNGVWRRRPAGM